MLRSLSVASGLVALVALVGCAGSSEGETESGAGAASTAPSSLAATVTEATLKHESERCNLDMVDPRVSIEGNPAATAKLQESLNPGGTAPLAVEDFCDGEGGFHTSIETHFNVSTNEKGILSIVVHQNTPSPSSEAFVFDLATGKRLVLGDILSQTGIGLVKAACTAGSESVEDPTSCELITKDSRNLEVTKERLTVRQDNFNEISVPWSKVDRNLLPSPIIAFLKR